MSNELAIRQTVTPETWAMIEKIAPVMATSRLFGVANPEAACAIMLKGYELGLSLTASFEFIQVIEGKPALSPRGALALVHQSPDFDGMKITDEPDKCTVWMKRKNGFEYEVSYTLEEAKNAGLVKPNSGWVKYPANMLRARAVGFCADVVYPDIIGGMKRADELGGEIAPDGNFEQVTIINGDTDVKSITVSTPDYGLHDLGQILELGVEYADFINAAKNQMPQTTGDWDLAVHNLIEAGILSWDGSKISFNGSEQASESITEDSSPDAQPEPENAPEAK